MPIPPVILRRKDGSIKECNIQEVTQRITVITGMDGLTANSFCEGKPIDSLRDNPIHTAEFELSNEFYRSLIVYKEI